MLFPEVMKFAELFGFAADQSAHRYDRLLMGEKAASFMISRTLFHAVQPHFSSGFTEQASHAGASLRKWEAFFSAESKKLLEHF